MNEHERELVRECALQATRHWPGQSVLGISPPLVGDEVTLHMTTDSRAKDAEAALRRDGWDARFSGNGGIVVKSKPEPVVRRETIRLLILNAILDVRSEALRTHIEYPPGASEEAERATDAVMGVIPRGEAS